MEAELKKPDSGKPEVTSKTRIKKINPQLKNIDEETLHHNKLVKLRILEDDEEIQKEEEKGDSEYEMDEEEEKQKTKETRKKTRSKNLILPSNRASEKFGKINLTKYFMYDKNSISYDFPNYNNIIVKPTKNSIIKICNVCYGLANYTCPRCLDKYCSKECFKTHSEIKCIKYLDV